MTKTEQLSKLIERHGGYLPLSEAQTLHISRTYLQEYIRNNHFERVACGIYKSPDVWTDDLYVLLLKNEKAVCSFDTALMLHGLTEREPTKIYLTVPKTYNATHLRRKGVVVYETKNEWADLGKTYAKTVYGNDIPVYDMDRTVCDLLRVKKKKDPQMFLYAIKEYAKSDKKNLPKLLEYARKFGVESDLRQYMEVLL